MRLRHVIVFSALIVDLVVSFAGCCVLPPVCPPPAPAPCPPRHFCPAVTEFVPASDRFPYLDPSNTWRTMSEGEFRHRFSLDPVGVQSSR